MIAVNEQNNQQQSNQRKRVHNTAIDPLHLTQIQDEQKVNQQLNKPKAKNRFSFLAKAANVEENNPQVRMPSQTLQKDKDKLTFRIQILRDTLRCITLMFIVFMSSLCVIFENTSWNDMWYPAYTYSILWIQYLDLLLTFFYGVQYNGSYISSIKRVCLYLIREKWFSILIPLFCYTLFVVTGLHIKLLLFGIFSAVWEIKFIINSTGERIFNSIKWFYIVKLLKLFLMIFFFAHSFACLWIYVPQKIRPDNWIQKYGLSDQPWSVQYINALYYIVVSMVTVGYGDIAPVNSSEKALCSLLIIISCGIYGYSLNQIGVIFNELNKNSLLVQEKKIYINKFMLRKNVSESLQCRVRDYLDYFWEQQFDDNYLEEGLKIIQQLNQNLKKQLIFESNNLVIRDSPIFEKNFTEDFLKKLTQIITEQKYMPEEIIYENESIDTQSIYFIEHGEVQVTQNSKFQSPVVQELTKGQNFGYFSFFTGQPRDFTARSKDFSVLLKIDLQPFLEILKEFEDDYEKYYYIRDQILYNSQYDTIYQKCQECQESTHVINACPLIHYCCDRIHLVRTEYSLNMAQIDRDPLFTRRQRKDNYRKNMIQMLDRYVDFTVAADNLLNQYEDDYLKQFYMEVDNLSPLNCADSMDNQCYNFGQQYSNILEEEDNCLEDGKYQEEIHEDNKTGLFFNNPIQSLNENNVEETSIFSKPGRKNSDNLTVSSYANLTPKNYPNSNGIISTKHNAYFYSNQNEEPYQVEKILNFQCTLRSNEEKTFPTYDTPMSKMNKFNNKREKSILSFKKILTIQSSNSLKKDSKMNFEAEKRLQLEKNNNNTIDDTEFIKPLSSYEGSQVRSRKSQKFEMESMKLMKIYFLKDNYTNVIQNFNTNNRYYSFYIKRDKNKTNSRVMSSNEQIVSKQEYIIDNEKCLIDGEFKANDSCNLHNQSGELNSQYGNSAANNALFRKSTFQQNKNRKKIQNILQKYINKNKQLNQSQSDEYVSKKSIDSSQVEIYTFINSGKELNKSKLSKASNFQKEYLQENKQLENNDCLEQDPVQEVINMQLNTTNNNNNNNNDLTIYSSNKEGDIQISEIQLESKINTLSNNAFQTKRVVNDSLGCLSQSTYLQHEESSSYRSNNLLVNQTSQRYADQMEQLSFQQEKFFCDGERELSNFESFQEN